MPGKTRAHEAMLQCGKTREHRPRGETVSVAIVTRNRARLLGETLRSLTRQAVQADEILVVDNASTDETRLVVESLQGVLPIRYALCRELGVNAARNCALGSSTCEILAFTDDDAEPEPAWLAETLAAFQRHDDVIAVQGVKENFYEDSWVASLTQFTSRDLSMARDRRGEEVTSATIVDTCNLALKRRPILEAGICFDNSLKKGGDRLFGHRLLEAGFRVLFSDSSIVRHKWPRTVHGYLKTRWESGVAKAMLMERLGPETFARQTQRWRISRILALALEKSGSHGTLERVCFLTLVFLGQLVNRLGFLKASKGPVRVQNVRAG